MTEKESNDHRKTEVWTRVITGCVGAIVVGLQGVNLTETNNQSGFIHRIDRALEQQVDVIKGIDQEGKRIDKALANQEEMIQSMEVLLRNQTTALELLKEKPKTN